jgi:hypothetical protein
MQKLLLSLLLTVSVAVASTAGLAGVVVWGS